MDSILPLILFTLVATITPGGATTLAAASGARFGLLRSVPLIVGIALGLASLAAVSAVGLGSVLLSQPALRVAVKAAGSLYLLWLASRIVRSGAPADSGGAAAPASLVGGACLLWLNPKGWAMALGAAASFAMLASGPGHLALLLGASFGAAECAAGALIARLLRTPFHWRVLNIAMGVLLAVPSFLPGDKTCSPHPLPNRSTSSPSTIASRRIGHRKSSRRSTIST
jgi:threonine/homoserine/homoserine lactone efflux protein